MTGAEPAEILREQVAAAIWHGQEWYHVSPWLEISEGTQGQFRHLADEALAATSGRILALLDELAGRWHGTPKEAGVREVRDAVRALMGVGAE